MWLEGKMQFWGVNFTRASSWEKKIERPNRDEVKQDKEKGACKGFSRTAFVCDSCMGLKLRLRERTMCVAGGFVTSHSHLQPSVYLFFVHTDVIAPWIPFLTEGAAAAPSWWLGGLSEWSEDRHSLFLCGSLPRMLLFAHFPPATREITHLLRDTTAPLFRCLSYHWHFILYYLSPCFAPPTKSALFRERDSVLFV